MNEKQVENIILKAIEDEVYGGVTMLRNADGALVNWKQFLSAVASNASKRAAQKIIIGFQE